MEHLIACGGSDSNLVIAIGPGCKEVPAVREAIDRFIARYESRRVRRVRKVADTIFPVDFYIGPAGLEAREHVYAMQRLASQIERRCIRRGTYFDRLIDWPGTLRAEDEPFRNQLEYRLSRLKTAWDRGVRTSNITELAVSMPTDSEECDCNDCGYVAHGDLRVQDPLMDKTTIGFPCLSHISLTLLRGHLNLTAIYRNQHFITKAYGNLVGLADLLCFCCAEIGCEVGELVCVATHADAELGKNGIPRHAILELVQQCSQMLGDGTT
jgi:hypothetical protein